MWKTSKLKDICRVFTDGNWIESKDQSVEGIRLVQTGNVKTGSFAGREDKARYISEETFKRLKCTEVIEGDILVSRLPEPVGRACVIPKLQEKAITAVDCTIIRTNEDVSPRYLNYYMQSPQYFSLVQEKVTGATRQRISRKNLGEVLVSIPPLAEQQRIVAKLDAAFAEIDRAVALTESKLTEAKNLLDASIAKIFADNLIGADYVVLDDVVTRLTNGYVGATKNIYQEEGIPYLLARHVKNNILKFDGKTFVSNEFNVKNNKSILNQDDVLLVQSGHIGHTAVVPMEHEGHNCHAMIVISTMKEALSGEYLSALFNSREYKAKLLSLRTGSTVPHLNCGDVKKVKIPIPNKETQKTIISLTKSATASFAAMEVSLLSKISGLKKLKSTILAQELQPPESEAA